MHHRQLRAAIVALLAACALAGRLGATSSPHGPQILGAGGGPHYDTGSPAYIDLYIAPDGSDDSGDGTADRPFQSIRRAWLAVAHDSQDQRLHAYRIRLQPGEYYGAYLDRETEAQASHGSASTPLMIESADPSNRARIVYDPLAARGNLTLFKISYAYLQNFDIRMDLTYGASAVADETGDGLQCEQCDHLLLRNMLIRGFYRSNLAEPMGQTETVKLNQSDHIYIEDSDIGGAGDNAIDAVAVRHGWWVRNHIHSSRDWCAYTKGGSADLLLAYNEVSDCGTGGLLAGQGTTIIFMRAPFLQHEAAHIKILNNYIHDVRGAGLGVNGGINILIAYNTLYRVGNDENRNHMLELAPGSHDCDGPSPSECAAIISAGGWGTSAAGVNTELVPNQNVYILNNLAVNPAGFRSPIRIFRLDGPRNADTGVIWSGPLPARSDNGAVIRGNIIWSGSSSADTSLGAGDSDQGCQADNPTCNPTQLVSENAINTLDPQLVNPAGGDLRPIAGGNVASYTPVAMPALDTAVLPEAQRALVQITNSLATSITDDYNGAARTGSGIGALVVDSQAGTNTPAPQVWIPLISTE